MQQEAEQLQKTAQVFAQKMEQVAKQQGKQG
jgi:hypothetical protein